MGTEGYDQDFLSAGPTTIEQGQVTTCADSSESVDHSVADDSTAAAKDGRASGEWSTIDTIPEIPSGTDHGLFRSFQDLAATPFWDSQETRIGSADSTLDQSQPSWPKPESIPREVVPGFEILSELGRGGMGVVYKARQLRLNRLVALKMIRDDRHRNPEDVARFEIEAEAVARLNHPNILGIYQFGRVGGSPFVALELLEGGSLAQRIAGTPQPAREAAALLSTLAKAVNAAHVAGILHRDIKPSNVLFDQQGIAKVADFGLAKRLEIEDGDTRTGQIMGTPSYMAPEQAKGWDRQIGPAADIYSLGAVLYEMLTGRPPLKGTTPAETIKLVLDEEPVPPSRLRPKVPFDLETICLKCLAKEPRKRYADALGLADDLDRFLADESIHARRTPLWERGIKLARRRPVTTLLLTAAVVAIGTGIGAIEQVQRHERIRLARENERIAGLSQQADQALFDAQGALAQAHWDDVLVTVARLLSRIEPEPRLAVAHAKAEKLREQAQRGIAEERERAQVQDRFRRFIAARDEAMFLDTRFTGLDPVNALEATCRSARNGLDVFGLAATGDEWILRPLPPALSAEQRDEVVAGFYELLFILADAVSQSPGAEPGQRAEAALRIVNGAACLRSPATRAYHLRRSAYLELKGDRAGASRERDEAERLAPADAFDFFLTGRELTKQSKWLAAITKLEAATQRQPDHFWAHCLLAICHLQTNQPSKARASLNACLQRKRDSVWLYLLRGLANAQAGKLTRDMARRYPDQAAALEAASSTQFEDAEADYRKALGLLGKAVEDDDLHYVLRVNRGLIQLERRDLTAAAADLNEAIRLNDHRFDAFSALGLVYQRLGRTDDALLQFARAIQLRPHWAPLYRARADLLLGLKKLTPEQRDAALRDLEDAIRYESTGKTEIAIDRTRQAMLLHQAGRNEEALEACAAALEITPGYAPAHRVRLKLLLELKRYHELIESCDVAIGSAKPSAELYELRGMARDARNDFPGAIADYTLALSLHAENARLLRRRGWSYLAQDAGQPAAHDFDEAIRIAPTNADGFNGRGAARARLGLHREAVSDAEEALRLAGSSWKLAYNAARIYAQAAGSAASEARRTGPEAVYLVSRYQDRAMAILGLAQQRAAAERRSVDFKESLWSDPVLQPLRRRLRSLENLDAK